MILLGTINVLFVVLFALTLCNAYEIETHVAITERAINSAGTGNYSKFLNTFQFDVDLARRTIRDGSDTEDDLVPIVRPRNHFYDPTNGQGLTVNGDTLGKPSLEWGFRDSSFFTGNIYSWTKAREYMYIGLTGKDFSGGTVAPTASLRKRSFQQMFRSLGQVMHLIEDLASPAHVRNDPHPSLPLFPLPLAADLYEKFTANPSHFSSDWLPGYPMVKLGQFSDYWSAPQGLAFFTNHDFISQDTNFDNRNLNGNLFYPSPEIQGIITRTETMVDQFGNNIQVDIDYGRNVIQDTYTGETLNNDRLTAFSVFDFEAVEILGERVYSVNDFTMESAANILVRRAVGYAAGLLDYFFRGTLEISMPGNYVYGIIDGSRQPQQFTQLKAKVKNTSIREEIQNGTAQIMPEPIQNGTLYAVAQYKKRVDYQPDLSTDPPTDAPTSREENFSYSVSDPIEIQSLSSQDPTEFTFYFSNTPIPAGITDLYLTVVFKGALGQETDAIAGGRKDLFEPMHINFFNASDYFYLDGVLRTSDEIRNDDALKSRVDFDQDNILSEPGEPYIEPYELDIETRFHPSNVAVPLDSQAHYNTISPGRYGRLIVLTDRSDLQLTYRYFSPREQSHVTESFILPAVTNQQEGATFMARPIEFFRGIAYHNAIITFESYPNNVGYFSAPWPQVINTDPLPASINP